MVNKKFMLLAIILMTGFGFISRSWQSVAVRTLAIFLMIALLTPVFLFSPTWKAQAQSNPPITQPAPISAPPEAFIISNHSSLSNSIASAFGSLLSFSGKTISTLLDKPKIPEGLEQPENQLTPVVNSPINNLSLLTLPSSSVRYDFDHDGKADIARWHASNTEWKVKNSSTGNYTTTTIGSGSSIIAPGDFDGDGYTDPAVFNAGTWTIKKSSNNQTITVSFGTSGDKPVVGDYDGDGLADAAVFRPSTNTWWILQSSNSSYTSTSFGAAGDITAQGNFDGDLKTDIAVFRPSTGDWHVLGSTSGYFTFHWGIATDIPVPADFDGDGKTDFAVYRGSTGAWYVSKSSTNNAQYFTQVWGNFGDQPVPADYDGDGKDDMAVWRPSNGVWYIIKSGSNPVAYDYQTLGQVGDTAVSSAYIKQIGGSVAGYDLAIARLSPKNSTGETDLYSRNFSWGTKLVNLTGRAGLDAVFGISYNSLVWTKEPVSNAIYFDADNSNVSPGFRLGFPTIEPVYWDKDAQRFNYLMVTPSGKRVEFRQLNGASDTYETGDLSYTQLKTTGASNPNDPVENISLTVSTTEGTKWTYLWKAGAFRCSEIKDRNGNLITINHDNQGLLQTVTDTLGRVITVNYDTELYPTSITQIWKTGNGDGSNVTHTWATFTYASQEINTNFGGVTVVGPSNGTFIKVLQKVTFPTESNGAGPNTVFSYNSWGQVKQITNYAADNHELNHTAVNLPPNASNQETDCPRFTETRNNVERFNGGNDVVIHNSVPESATYNFPGSITGSASLIKVWMDGHPNNLITKIYVGSSGWKEGLQIGTEDCISTLCSGTDKKRWTWSYWTQDDENLSYIQNPRMIESKVGDTTNIKRTTTEYYTVPFSNVAVYGLVREVSVYDTDQTTILKKAYTEYNLDTNYTSKRIIGLRSKTELYGRESSGLNLISKTTYGYDEYQYNSSLLNQNIPSVIQHDTTNFAASFQTGRGNVTSIKSWDIADSENSSKAINSTTKYNIAGAPVEQIDMAGRAVQVGYADAFNDNQNRDTFAFPTTVTDSATKLSKIIYRFDIGENVWAKSPSNTSNPNDGKKTIREYDSVGRVSKETLFNTGAYTRYVYPANNIQIKAYSTVVDTNDDGADASDEVLTEGWVDGAGRSLRSRTANPGSTGGWSATINEYDILGRVKRSTIPTEISVTNENNPETWQPAGDDVRFDSQNNSVWLWTEQEYDWKGRVTKTINTDGTESLMSFDGCGCAGKQITTIQGESVPVPGQTGTFARRTQKIYADILGRDEKKETLNWDGTVYSTVKTAFNGRDQVVEVKQYAGDDTSSTFQTTLKHMMVSAV
jgi:YD repeat-containing protein